MSKLQRVIMFCTVFVRARSMSGIGFNDLSGWPANDGGLTHVRIWDIGVAWNQIHYGSGKYDWSRLDMVVAQAQSFGAKITYAVGGCPLWLAKYPDNPYYASWLGPGSNSMPYDIDQFNEFIWNLATRYLGRINYYEIWNEPQLADFLYPYNSDELATLAQMTLRAHNTIKSIDPSAYILSGSLLPRASSGGMSKAMKYLDAIQAKGWNIDAFATHIYPENGKGADAWRDMLVDCQSTIASYKPPTSKVWVTETTYNLLGDVIPEDQAGPLVNATYNYASENSVMQIYWYGWDQTSLGGLQLNFSSAAWAAIKSHA